MDRVRKFGKIYKSLPKNRKKISNNLSLPAKISRGLKTKKKGGGEGKKEFSINSRTTSPEKEEVALKEHPVSKRARYFSRGKKHARKGRGMESEEGVEKKKKGEKREKRSGWEREWWKNGEDGQKETVEFFSPFLGGERKRKSRSRKGTRAASSVIGPRVFASVEYENWRRREGRGGERILSSVFLTGTWNQQRMEMGWVPQVRLPLSEGVEKFSHWICFICHALLVAVHVSGELRINMKASEGEEREKERKNTLSLFFRIDIFLETLPHLALNTYGG